jgi:hypothetical protein
MSKRSLSGSDIVSVSFAESRSLPRDFVAWCSMIDRDQAFVEGCRREGKESSGLVPDQLEGVTIHSHYCMYDLVLFFALTRACWRCRTLLLTRCADAGPM